MKKVQMEEYIPQEFKFTIGGFWSGNCIVEFKDNKLTHSISNVCGASIKILTSEIKPKESEWKKFWNRVDELQVWKWDKNYIEPCCEDGVQWSLSIKKKNKTKNSYGSNRYPESYNQFKDAISELLGGLSLDEEYCE
jgi:hypothetical protein